MAQGKKLFLRGSPFRHQNVRQGRLGLEHIPRRTGVNPLDKSGSARLHHRHIAVVEGEDSRQFKTRRQHATADTRQAHADVLGQARVNMNRRSLLGATGVARHQLHIHEGRFARLVEFLLRVHRVVPVQRLFIVRRLHRPGHVRLCLAHLRQPVAAAQAQQQHAAQQGHVHDSVIHWRVPRKRNTAGRRSGRAAQWHQSV